MEYIIIVGILLITLIILYFILGVNIKKIKAFADDKTFNKITDKFPENTQICKEILKELNNESVKIEEDNETKTSLYLVTHNKVIIGNKENLFTRIQTIAHECIHSTQSKKMLWFNYIFSNIYIIYFVTISILTILKIITNTMLQVEILTILGTIFYFVRSMLETEAMLKARYVAKDYMQKSKICTNEEIDELIAEYDNVNNIGVKFYNFTLLFNAIIKLIIYCVICIIVI